MIELGSQVVEGDSYWRAALRRVGDAVVSARRKAVAAVMNSILIELSEDLRLVERLWQLRTLELM